MDLEAAYRYGRLLGLYYSRVLLYNKLPAGPSVFQTFLL